MKYTLAHCITFLSIQSEQTDAKEKLVREQTEIPLSLSTKQGVQNREGDGAKTVAEDCSSSSQVPAKIGQDDSDTEASNNAPTRPMSPGTLALMCDEQDAFLATSFSNGQMGADGNSSAQLPHCEGMTGMYRGQEKLILMALRDCLNRLITVGEIKGKF